MMSKIDTQDRWLSEVSLASAWRRVGSGRGLLAATGIGLVLATNPAVAAKHCDWRMDLPINLSVDYDKLFLRSASGEPVVSYFNPRTGSVRLFTVEKEVTRQYRNDLSDFKIGVDGSGRLPKKMDIVGLGDVIGDNPSITLGDTTISRRLEMNDPASAELFGDFDGSICDDVGYEYLLVEKAGAPSRKLVLLAMLPKKTRTFKKTPAEMIHLKLKNIAMFTWWRQI